MDQLKRRLRATVFQGQGVHGESSESMVDIFSNLPDQVAHHILSFLAIDDLTRFGCVSKRCRELCLTTPSLNFDEFSSENTSTCYHRLKLLSYLDRFFIQRGDNKIQSFRVRWVEHIVENFDDGPCFCEDENFRMFSWVQKAVRCKVESLDLEMALYRYTVESFPSCVFLCESLKSLVLSRTILKTPTSVFSSNLKYLELGRVHINDVGFFNWISCSCKCLEELHLQQPYGTDTVTVESSSLKKFSFFAVDQGNICHISISGERVVDIVIAWKFDSPSNRSLHIYAPNLKGLQWTGDLMNHQNLGKLEHLEEAGVLLESKGGALDNVFEGIHSLCKAKILVLNEETIKAAFRQGSRPALLYDTHTLCMRIGSYIDELMPAILSLFTGMVTLSNLYIKSNQPSDGPKSNTCGINMDYWKLHNPGFVHQLKQVTIELCNGSNGIELARYMLEYAPNLLGIVVIYFPQDLEKVQKLKNIKTISNAKIVFLENKQY